MLRKKVYRLLSIAVTAATLTTTAFPAEVLAARADSVLLTEEAGKTVLSESEEEVVNEGTEDILIEDEDENQVVLTEEAKESELITADTEPGTEARDYTQNGNYEFTFKELTLDPESATVNAGTDVTVNDDGSATIKFKGQYAQAFFNLPEGINSRRVSRVEFAGANPGGFSVKVLPKPGDDSLNKAAYGSNVLGNLNGVDFSYIAAMGLSSGVSEYSVSKVIITLQDEPVVESEEVQLDIPDLWKSVASDEKGLGNDAFMGTCIGSGSLNDKKLVALVKKHFNAITLENELKPDSVLNGTNGKLVEDEEFGLVPEALNFSNPDRMLDTILEWNKNENLNIKVRGHVLTWHEQTPTWFFRENYESNGAYVTPEVMTKRHEWYIKSVLNHYFAEDSKYKDLFYGFDVVNEACSDNLGTYRAASGEGKNSEWARIYGTGSADDAPDYILNAFRFANKYAPKSLELYYNDYNDCEPGKVPVIERLLKSVKKHEKDEVNPTRITGFGMQGHHGIDSPSKDQIIDCARRYGNIVGKIQVTELDVKASNGYDGSAAAKTVEYTKMGHRYKDIYDAYREVDSMPGIDVNSFTVWGTIDSVSWLNSANGAGGGANGSQKQCPLLFDGKYQAKPAYWAIVNSEEHKLDPVSKSVNIMQKAKGNDPYKFGLSYSFDDIDVSFIPVWENDGVSFKITAGDRVNVKEIKLYSAWDDKTENPGICVSVPGNKNGSYILKSEVENPVGKRLRFDIVVTLDDEAETKVAFNNIDMTHDENSKFFAVGAIKPSMEIVRSSVVIDGVNTDGEWDKAVETDLLVKGNEPEASAKARVLWDNDNLYVFMDVTDSELDDKSGQAHEQDSIEVFIDENNAKAGSYQEDDKQYRINYKGVASFNGNKCKAENVDYKVIENEKGYTVEAAFKWTDVTPAAGQVIGIDLQINDAKAGSRIGTLNWFDATGNGWSNPGVFGEAVLKENDGIQPIADQVYTGENITPDVVIISNGKQLVSGKDYTISFSNNKEVNEFKKIGDGIGDNYRASLPTATVDGLKGITGRHKINFNILPLDIANSDDITIKVDDYIAQSATVSKPAVTVLFKGKKISADEYEVKYSKGTDGEEMDNIPENASNKDGDYYAVVKGENSFTGKKVVKLNIVAQDQVKVSSFKVVLPKSRKYTGNPVTLSENEIKVSYKGKDVARVEDPATDGYMISYADNTEVGKAKVIITGAGVYTGSRTETFSITGLSFKGAKVSKPSNIEYTGEPIIPTFKVTYKADTVDKADALNVKKGTVVTLDKTQYSVECVKGGTNAGTARYVITGKGLFSGSVETGITINKAPASKVYLRNIAPQSYVKKGVKPALRITFEGSELKEGKDYKASYSNNNSLSTEKKKAKVTLVFKGNFKGKITKTFDIVQADLAKSVFAQAIDVVAKNGDYKTKVTLTDLTSDKVLKAGTDYNKTVSYECYKENKWVKVEDLDKKDLVAGTRMRVRVEGKGNYKGSTVANYMLVSALMNDASVKVPPLDYTGRSQELKDGDLIVKLKVDGKNVTLRYGVDYIIKYQDEFADRGKHMIEIVPVSQKYLIGGSKLVKVSIK